MEEVNRHGRSTNTASSVSLFCVQVWNHVYTRKCSVLNKLSKTVLFLAHIALAKRKPPSKHNIYNHDYRSINFLESHVIAVQNRLGHDVHTSTLTDLLLNQQLTSQTCTRSLKLPACQMPCYLYVVCSSPKHQSLGLKNEMSLYCS